MQERARIRVVVDVVDVPRSAKIEARIRSESSRVYQPYLMPWVVGTATQAALALTLDEPRYEMYVEARVGKKVVAQAASATEPFVVEPAPVPSLAEAWATSDPQKNSTATSTTAAAVIASMPSEGEAWGSREAWLLGGGVLAAVLIGVVVVLIATGTHNDCDAKEGFGCSDVSVRPLLRF